MNVVLQSRERTLVSLTFDELNGICSALNEVCNDSRLRDQEFQTRLGVTREFLLALLSQMPRNAESAQGSAERTGAWADQGSVQVIACPRTVIP